jgi:protein-disulfide isomerase
VAALLYHSKPVPAPAAPEPPAIDRSALVRFHSPSLGDAAARVHIVEFFDPACEACRAVYPLVKRLMDSHPGRIRLTIRYAPFHKGVDQVVRLLEASKRQGKYWQTVEALLASQPEWAINHVARLDLALSAVAPVGLDMRKLQDDMQGPELAQLIQQDVEDAVRLNVTRTPEFFVNGRQLTVFGFDELQALVEKSLREAYSG